MGSLVLTGDTSGSVTLTVPLVAGSNTATIAAATGTHYPFTAGTAVASTSGTSIDFTSIPSWVKRITVMISGVSTNGSSNLQAQIGAGSVTTSGYVGSAAYVAGGTQASFTAGFGIVNSTNAGSVYSGSLVLMLISGNTWVASGNISTSGNNWVSSGVVTLSGTLDRVRITTSNGTDTFDAGSINILYE